MKMIALIFILAYIFLHGHAQDNAYLNYRIILPPQTNCFAKKGELKFVYLHQHYSPNMSGINETWMNWIKTYSSAFYSNFMADNESRLSLGYTLGDHFTIETSYINLLRIGNIFIYEQDIDDHDYIEYQSIINSYELSASYHKNLTNSLAYEFGTSFLLGWGNFSYDNWENDAISKLSYNTFNHNFLGAISYRYMKLYLTILFNAGYVYHFNTDPKNIDKDTYDKLAYNFDNHRTDLYIDPAILVGINYQRFCLQGHLVYPYAFGENKISRPLLMMGIGISYKILRSKNEYL